VRRVILPMPRTRHAGGCRLQKWMRLPERKGDSSNRQALKGLDHRVGHPMCLSLALGSSRRTERRRRYLDEGQDGGKHRARLLPEKLRCGSCPIRARKQEMVHRREAGTLPSA
jgi:hypothetical protein